MVAQGAYGLKIEDLSARELLNPSAPGWPSVRIGERSRRALVGSKRIKESIDSSEAVVWVSEDAHALCDRRQGSVTLFTAPGAETGEVTQALLAVVGVAFGWWLGRETLHAGAFLHAGRAWGLLGGNQAGKSSMLASLAASGHPVFTDDVLAVHALTAFAGPRCVDLREEAMGWLPGIGELHPARCGTRRRLIVPPVPPEAPLAGWVFLEWGGAIELTRIPPAQRLRRLGAARCLRMPPTNPGAFLELSELPAWELRRPRGKEFFSQGTGRLLEALSG